MKVELRGETIHVATGGRPHVAGRPFLIFLHGAGNSHLTWIAQTRALAYDGFNVIAPDMPGHNLSSGEPLPGVQEEAAWLGELMDALGCEKAVLIGHSQGGLVTLEAAHLMPERVVGAVFIATAAAIPVNPALIDMAETQQDRAINAMIAWGHGAEAAMHDNTWPGASNIFLGIDVMHRNKQEALPVDLKACAAYERGLEIASSLKCPSLCIFAQNDRMTPLKFGIMLAAALPDCELHVLEKTGHMIPVERSREVNSLLRSFLAGLNAKHAA